MQIQSNNRFGNWLASSKTDQSGGQFDNEAVISTGEAKEIPEDFDIEINPGPQKNAKTNTRYGEDQ